MDYRSASTTTIQWHYSNGSKELHLPLTIDEISDIIRGLLEKYPTFGREKETGLLGALDT